MGVRYLIDTNAAIDFLNNKLPQNGKRLLAGVFDENPLLSVVLITRNVSDFKGIDGLEVMNPWCLT